MAMSDQEWSIILKAAIDTTEADSQLQKYINTYKNASNKKNELELELTLTSDEKLQKQLEKRIAGVKGTMTKMQKEITNIMNDPKMWKQTYSTQYIQSIKNAEEERLKAVKQTNQKILQDTKNLYSQLAKIKKLEATDGISDSDLATLKSQEKSIIGKIGKNNQAVKASGDTSALASMNEMSSLYQNSQKVEKVQANIKRQAEEINASYRLARDLTREIGENQKAIATLEKQKGVDNTEEINVRQRQVELLQQQKDEQMKILNVDKEKSQEIEHMTQKYQNETEVIKSQNTALDETKNKLSKIKDYLDRYVAYVALWQAINLVQQGVQQSIELVKELDAAFTDIQMVTGDTAEDIKELSVEYNELAKQMGSTTVEVAQGATEWLRQGKSIEETTQLLKSSMTLSKVGAMESAEATELLTSTLNGYKMEAEDAMGVVDKISAIDMAAATSSEELMTALSRTANSADDAGVSFDKLLAMIATTSSVTRKSASTIGESFKTIFARMSNVAAGKDIDDTGESLNDVEESLEKVGIKLRDSQDEWRNFEEVIDEVAGKWDDFTSTQQSQVATAIAGTRQQENFRALMNNWEQVEQLVGVAETSTGSASQKMEIYLDSVEAKTNQLKTSWENLLITFNQSDSYKTLLDMLNWMLNNLPTVISLVSAFIITWKGATIFKTVSSAFSSLTGTISSFVSLVKEGTTKGSGFVGTLKSIGSTAKGLAGTMNLAAGAIGLIITAITLGVQAYNDWKQSQFEAVSATNEAVDSLKAESETIEDNINQYTKIINSTDSLETKKSQLTDMQEKLTESFDTEKTKIDLVNGSYEEQIDLLRQLEKENLKNQVNEYNQNASTREGLLDDNTNQLIYDYNSESEAGKLLKDTVQKYGGIGAFNTTSTYSPLQGWQVNASINTNAENLVKIYEELQEKSKDLSQSAQEELGEYLNASTWLQKSMKEDYEKYAETFNTQQQAELANYKYNNFEAYNDYRNSLEEKQKLLEKYNEAETEDEKQKYAEQMKIYDQTIEDKKEALYKNASETVQKQLDNEFSSLTINTDDYLKIDWEGTKFSSDDFIELKKQIESSGTLTDDLKKKIIAFRQELEKKGNEDFLKNFDSQLESIGISINNNTKKWSEFRAALTSPTREYQANEDGTPALDENGNMIGRELSDFEKLLKIEEDLKNELKMEGVQFSDDWYNSLRTQLEKGEISGQQFFDSLSEGAKAFGVDIENAVSKVDEISTTKIPMLGTQQEFVDEMDSVDQMYSDAATLKEGGTLDNQRIVDLRNEYEELNDYIAETGDLTLKNGQMLTDIANQTYDDGTKAIDSQIDALEDYQDAILNTVDAMGIMAEFQEELKKIDEDLAETITDDAVKEAKAKGEFADISESTADGVYDANETIQDSEGKTYSLLEAQAKGIIDTKNEEMQAKVKAAEESVRALYDEAAVSEEAYTLSADYIEQNRQALLDKGWTEEQITDAKTKLAGIQVNADGSIAVAAQEQAATTQDAELATAKAFVSVTLAAISTANSIASLFGIQSDALTQAQKDLEAAQSTINEVEQNKQDQAKIAAQLTAENAAKIKELEARKNQIGSARNIGNSTYGSAGKKSGGSGSSKKSDAEKLAEDIADFREDESISLEDVTEELINQYKTEERKLKLQQQNLEYAEGLVDAEEETTKWIKLQNQQLTNQRKQIQSIYRENSKINQQFDKIQKENPKYDISSWFDEDGNATLAYANLLNSFAEQERKYRKTVSINSEEDLKNAEKYIEKLEEERDYVENLFDSASQLKDAWIENREELQNLFTEMNDTLKEMRDTLLDKFMGALEDRVEEVNQVYEDNISKLESLITVQEKYNDVINNALDTQAELKKELQTNKDSYQYLDDYMRSIIFNEEDYKLLSGELDDLMSEMDVLAEEYQNKINNLTEDEMYKIEEITNEYERQVELKEKEYELLKAELDVVKARTKLENAKNERTVRMFVDGAWQWVADPDAIKSASEELADAEAEKDRIEREQEQQQEINDMEQQIDDNQLEIEKNEQLLDQIQDRVDEITTETKSIEEWLELIATEGPPMLHDIFDDIGTKLEELLDELGNDSSLVDNAGANTTEAIKQGLLNGTLDPNKWAEKVGWIKGDNGKWYAPKDDPYYDPAGFDFGTVKPETSTTTDESGVQVQGSSNASKSENNKSNKTFPRQGSLKGVSSVLRIRSGAGLDYKVVGYIPPSGHPQVLGEKGDWAQVKYNGVTGWSSRKYLTYDKGGLMSGKGVALKDILKPEYVLSSDQTKAWMKLVDNLTNPALANLTKTPTVESKKKEMNQQYVGDTFTFNGVTVQANDIQEFIDSIKGMVPITNR